MRTKFAIAVTRHAGQSKLMPSLRFPTETRYVKSNGQVLTFDQRIDAETVKAQYENAHRQDEHAICKKSYVVTPIHNGHGTG